MKSALSEIMSLVFSHQCVQPCEWWYLRTCVQVRWDLPVTPWCTAHHVTPLTTPYIINIYHKRYILSVPIIDSHRIFCTNYWK